MRTRNIRLRPRPGQRDLCMTARQRGSEVGGCGGEMNGCRRLDVGKPNTARGALQVG
jgi:hypothetical protein